MRNNEGDGGAKLAREEDEMVSEDKRKTRGRRDAQQR